MTYGGAEILRDELGWPTMKSINQRVNFCPTMKGKPIKFRFGNQQLGENYEGRI
jgi:hypothetical protein